MRRGLLIFLLAMFAVAPVAEAGDRQPSVTERRFVGMLNEERIAQGLTRVEISPALTGISDDYVAYNEQVGGIDHSRDAPYTERANEAGCGKWNGPVLAQGYTTARGALDAWLNSEGHRAVLLDPDITHIGPGFKGQYALAYGMVCEDNALNDSDTYGDPNAQAVRLHLSKVFVRGRVISVFARTSSGTAPARLIARQGDRVVRGSRKQLGGSRQQLRVRVPSRGRWRVSLRVAGGRTYRLGRVFVDPA